MFNTYIITSDTLPLEEQKHCFIQLKDYPFKEELGIQFRFNHLSDEALIEFINAVKPYLEGIKLLINNRIDLMEDLKLDGVHLKDQTPNLSLKTYQKQKKLIFKSTHSLASIQEAENLGFDAITYGPVFNTPSKRKYGPPNGYDLLKQQRFNLPIFALGGIHMENIQELKPYVHGIAAIRLFMNDNIIEHLHTRRQLWKS